jgi:hypothetical protein
MMAIKSVTVFSDDGTSQTFFPATPPPQAQVIGPAPAVLTLSHPQATSYSGTLIAPITFDFGDPSAAFNNVKGLNASHLYDKPGTYTVSVGGVIQTVTVLPDTRKRFYISTSATTGDGSTPDAPMTLSRALDLLRANPSNTTLLFKCVDVFSPAPSVTITGSNIHVTSYGSGPLPVMVSVNGGGGFSTAITASQTVIENLDFQTSTPTNLNDDGAGVALQPGGRDCAIRDCLLTGVSTFVNCNMLPTGVLIMNNTAPTVTSMRAYLCWGQGTDLSIFGNNVPNVTREHVIRIGGAHRVNVFGNTLANLDRTSQDSQDIAKGVIVLQKGDFMCAINNAVSASGIGTGPLGGADGTHDPDARAQNSWIEGNTVTGSIIAINPGVEGVMVFGNTITGTGIGTDLGILINATDNASPVYVARMVKNATISGNKFSTTSTSANFIKVNGTIPAVQVALTNNTMNAANFTTGADGSAAVYVGAADLSAFASISGNHWPLPQKTTWVAGAAMYVWPIWSDPKGYLTPAQWNALPQVNGRDIFA